MKALYPPEVPLGPDKALGIDLGFFPGEPFALLLVKVLAWDDVGHLHLLTLRVTWLGLDIVILPREDTL